MESRDDRLHHPVVRDAEAHAAESSRSGTARPFAPRPALQREEGVESGDRLGAFSAGPVESPAPLPGPTPGWRGRFATSCISAAITAPIMYFAFEKYDAARGKVYPWWFNLGAVIAGVLGLFLYTWWEWRRDVRRFNLEARGANREINGPQPG
jgi:hypothetical protein